MTPQQKTFFRDHGYLCLKQCLARNQVDPIRDHILNELKRLRLWSGGKRQSRLLSDVPIFQQVGKLGQLVRFSQLQQAVITERVRSAIDELAGQPLVAPDAQLLLSLPNQGEWRLDGLNWHVDIASGKADRLPGIQVFALIDDVLPRGGATLAIVGSHRLQGGKFSGGSNIRQLLNEGQDIERSLDEVGLALLEMTGRAGDVYLMDMRLLHTPAINATKSVRMMATARCHAALT